MLTVNEVLPGVYHIRDALGVCMTLLCGGERALLVDTGYGAEDAGAFVRSITDKPVTVLLTHAHHDHALGARWFERVLLFPQDAQGFAEYTSPQRRARVAQQAQAAGIAVSEDYLTHVYSAPQTLLPGDIALGGMTAQVRLCPGHTPGSAVVYVPERALLITGDDWNPCTWLFFPEALGAQAYRTNLRALLELPFEHVLCSHQPALYPRAALEAFAAGLTDDALRAARRVEMGLPCDTREAAPAPGQIFVFDYGKAGLE